MFDYVTFPKFSEFDGNDGPITLEALALAAFNAAVEANSSDSVYEAGKLERRFVEFLDVYARTYVVVHGYVKPSVDLKIEGFGRDEDPLVGWDEIPSDAGDERFNLPSSRDDAPTKGTTFRNGKVVEEKEKDKDSWF